MGQFIFREYIVFGAQIFPVVWPVHRQIDFCLFLFYFIFLHGIRLD